MFKDVRDFHEKFGLAYDEGPRKLDPDLEKLRMVQMREETEEMDEAASDEERFDACIDKVYFIIGYCYLRGWDFNEGWRRVHKANMLKQRAKEDGSDSKRNSGKDVVKPEGWVHPDLSDLVTEFTFNWDEVYAQFIQTLTKLICDDRTSQVVTLGATIRINFKEYLVRFNTGERSKLLYAEMNEIIKDLK